MIDKKHTYNNYQPKSDKALYRSGRETKIKYWFYGFMVFVAITFFIPWTQNISTAGNVTTLRQEQRPQEINTVIAGKVAKWFVKEGDYVKAGDTIIELAEVKDAYLDPELLKRTKEQIEAKLGAIESYQGKANVQGQQLIVLQKTLSFKLSEIENKISQQRMKINSDSMDMLAAINDYKIKTAQYERQLTMYDSGLVSLTQLETRNQAKQDAQAKKNNAEIKFNNSRQELLRFQIEQNSARQEYIEKMQKVEGDRYQVLSEIATGEGEVAKLENQYMNYNVRQGLYFITAPQDGQVIKARKAGLGEVVKEGEMIVEIVPDNMQYAVEIFVRPVDVPLLAKGQHVQFLFDGYPALVFTGWPKSSFGTFSGKVVAIESSLSKNGKFRVLVAEDSTKKSWPKTLRVGAGAQGILLLNDVPVWYELWRNINGFPPDFYTPKQAADENKSKY
jgi:multidrug efflux pump subunit AcrA (membrane-fusion protein)